MRKYFNRSSKAKNFTVYMDRRNTSPKILSDKDWTTQATTTPKIGELLIKERYINPEDLKKALDNQEQRRKYQDLPLGEILVEIGARVKNISAENMVTEALTRFKDYYGKSMLEMDISQYFDLEKNVSLPSLFDRLVLPKPTGVLSHIAITTAPREPFPWGYTGFGSNLDPE